MVPCMQPIGHSAIVYCINTLSNSMSFWSSRYSDHKWNVSGHCRLPENIWCCYMWYNWPCKSIVSDDKVCFSRGMYHVNIFSFTSFPFLFVSHVYLLKCSTLWYNPTIPCRCHSNAFYICKIKHSSFMSWNLVISALLQSLFLVSFKMRQLVHLLALINAEMVDLKSYLWPKLTLVLSLTHAWGMLASHWRIMTFPWTTIWVSRAHSVWDYLMVTLWVCTCVW